MKKVNFTEQQFKELWYSGLSNREIRRILNISEYVLYQAKTLLNLPEKKIGRPRKKLDF